MQTLAVKKMLLKLEMFCHESIYQTPLTFLVKNNRKKSSVESDIYTIHCNNRNSGHYTTCRY